MDVGILLVLRIIVLALLWIFILAIVRVLRRDAQALAGPAPTLKGAAPRLLTIVDGPLTGSNMDISRLQELTLGRSQNADFVVNDDFASGRHARLFRRGADWFLEDLASRNGTFLAGMRIEQPEPVRLGSDIKIGQTTLRLEP